VQASGDLPSRSAGVEGRRYWPRETVVQDVDAASVTMHSEKASAAASFNERSGYHPFGAWP
jgi:hypothetical protein